VPLNRAEITAGRCREIGGYFLCPQISIHALLDGNKPAAWTLMTCPKSRHINNRVPSLGGVRLWLYAQHGHLLGGVTPLKEKVVQLLANGRCVIVRWGGKEAGRFSLQRTGTGSYVPLFPAFVTDRLGRTT
jgi:hypothetical protein